MVVVIFDTWYAVVVMRRVLYSAFSSFNKLKPRIVLTVEDVLRHAKIKQHFGYEQRTVSITESL